MMASATASPETSPARKPGSEINTQKARRSLTGEEQSPAGEFADNVNNEKSENQDTVVRKGRGNFKGPSSENQPDQQQQAARSPRGREFDATSLRQYPPRSGGDKTTNKSHRKKSTSDSRRNSNGVESGGSSSDNNVSDGVAKVTASLEVINIGDNENESNPTVQSTANELTLSASQGQQNIEDWEKCADVEVNANNAVNNSVTSPITSPVDGSPNPFDWSANKQKEGQKNDNSPKNENRGGFKKGHKKSKSSKIEFNYDPDAYEGSTRILDIFDFPASFKTHHLHEIFQEYENMRGGYRIKWMDDTRALIIFEHPATARKAYLDNVTNQLATIKPYDGPTDFLQKNPNNAQPRARPATTDMVAKRLVHGALGVRVVRSPEQRQADNQILRNARDQQKRNDYRRSQDVDAAFNE